jgi:hypothetical protein
VGLDNNHVFFFTVNLFGNETRQSKMDLCEDYDRNSVFCYITLCCQFKITRGFEETFIFRLQGRKISQGRKQHQEDISCVHWGVKWRRDV